MTHPLQRYLAWLPLIAVLRGMRREPMAACRAAGADGFGTGSKLYHSGAGADDVRAVAAAYARAFRALPAR